MVLGAKDPDGNLLTQFLPVLSKLYPSGQRQTMEPSVFWQSCEHPPLFVWHSLMSTETFGDQDVKFASF